LPGFFLFLVVLFVVLILIVVVVFRVVLVVVLVFFIRVVDVLKRENGDAKIVTAHTRNTASRFQEAAGSGAAGAGLALSRAGGGYVVQKWRPHLGHTQN
jgi:uncharacterized membrane-anchored protein YitT (DUF2179 family)